MYSHHFQEYELLNIIDFNNTRKRMSVILKRNNKIFLYCKGADNVIYDRLGGNQNDVKNRTQEHLNVSFENYANCLRDLETHFILRNSLVKV